MTDPELGAAAERAEQRLRAVLGVRSKRKLENLPYRVPVLERDQVLWLRHAEIRRAAEASTKLRLGYLDGEGRRSERVVWPLALMGLGERWMLLAWCEDRSAYRNFRLDRIQALQSLPDRFQTSETINIGHYYRTELGIADSF